MTDERLLHTTRDGEIVVLKLDRADKRNALSDAFIDEIDAFFSAPPPDARVVVLHGEGKHFCAGLDLVERMSKRSGDAMGGIRHSRRWHQVFDKIQYGELPVVSVLKGGVIGGGLELATSTHVRVAEASTFYQLPEGQRGIFVGGGASVRVPRIIGAGRVVEMMLTGRSYSAEEGQALALSHYLVADGAGLAKAMALARAIASNAPVSNFAIINGIAHISEMSTADGMFAETMVATATRFGGADSAGRIASFFEGRKALQDKAADTTP